MNKYKNKTIKKMTKTMEIIKKELNKDEE